MRYRAFPESRDTEHFRFYYNKSTFAKVTLQIFYNNSFSPKQRRALFNKFTFAEVTPRTFLINSLLTKQRRAFFYNKFVFAPRKRTLRTKELHEEKT